LKKEDDKDSFIFHAGTQEIDGRIVTNGGRVLCATSYGRNIRDAVENSILMLEDISFEGMYYRTDIGYEFQSKKAIGR
jgi:phosphoribosylamine---glycine ligase